MSTRISNSSAYENSEQPMRSASVSPRGDRRPPYSPAPVDGTTLVLGSQAFLDTDLVNQGDEDTVDNRLSHSPVISSHANSSAGTSEVDKNHVEDSQKISRFGSVSTSSEYPAGTSKKVKSPPGGNRSLGNGEGYKGHQGKDDLLPFDIQSSMFEFGVGTPIQDCIMVAGESEGGSKTSLPLAKGVTRKEIGSPPKREDRKGNAPEIVVQSPITPTFSHVKEEPKSPRAEKALRVPFLHKFKRSDSKVSTSDSATFTLAAVPQPNKPHSHEQVSSFLDSLSSDGEEENNDREGDHAFLGNA